MGYENSPATKFIATNCCFCARPLVDQDSLAVGYGSTCAEKNGLPHGGSDPFAKSEAGKLLFAIAVHQKGVEVEKAVARIRELGFDRCADAIVARLRDGVPTLTHDGERFFLAFPYNAALVTSVKNAVDSARGRKRFVNDSRGKGWELDVRGALAILPLFEGRLDVHADARKALEAPAAPLPAPQHTQSVWVTGDKVEVATPYNPQAVQRLKGAAQGQARWNAAEKRWSFPVARAGAVAEALRPFFPAIADELVAAAPVAAPSHETLSAAKDVSEAGSGTDLVQTTTEKLAATLPEGKVPYAYQNVGVAFLEATDGNALVADEMGLGKTWQALGYHALHPEYKLLVICPASLTLNWAKETAGLLPGRRVTLALTTKTPLPATPDVVIISYDLAVRRRAELEALKFDAVVVDECQLLKSEKAARTKAILGYDRVVEAKPATEVRA